MRQVISIAADGTISGLQVKPGKGIDLRQFGKAQIERASDIKFDEERQQWYVHILKGRYAGLTVTKSSIFAAREHGDLHREIQLGDTAYFDEYDHAVSAEIEVLDAVRLRYGSERLA